MDVAEANERRPLFQMSHKSLQLINHLKGVQVGEVVTYADMNKIVGGNVQQEKRSCLVTARKRLMQDEMVHFGTIINVGIKRLNESEATESLDLDVSKIRTRARHVHTKTRLIEIDPLSSAERLKVAMVQTLTAVIAKSTASRSQQRLLDAGENVSLKEAFAALSGG